MIKLSNLTIFYLNKQIKNNKSYIERENNLKNTEFLAYKSIKSEPKIVYFNLLQN